MWWSEKNIRTNKSAIAYFEDKIIRKEQMLRGRGKSSSKNNKYYKLL